MAVLDLTEAARLIAGQVAAPGARFAIADEGHPDEAALMGTRDGLLNLALAVVRFVAEADADRGWESDGRFAWDDGVKAAMHQLPTAGAVWLVGAYLFRDHAALMAELARWGGGGGGRPGVPRAAPGSGTRRRTRRCSGRRVIGWFFCSVGGFRRR